MSGGIYAALSGMQVRMEDLDRLAADLANVGTSGYKAHRAASEAVQRTQFSQALDAAIDVATGEVSVDMRSGVIGNTGRELDAALESTGFFVLETPEGVRYTRDGSFTRRGDGVLVTRDGNPVLGEDGEIRLGPGTVDIGADGTVRAGETVAGRLKVVVFDGPDQIARDTGARFRAVAETPPAADPHPRVVGGALEAANVTVVDRMVALTAISRSFEGLQRGISVLSNDIDGRAISELGRR